MKHALVLMVGLAILVGSALAAEKAMNATFSAPKDKVYAVALDLGNSEARILRADKDSGTIAVRTRTRVRIGLLRDSVEQDITLLIAEGGTADETKLSVGIDGQGTIVKQVTRHWLHRIGERLHKDGLIPESEIPKK